jgi:hypothetical protein
MRRFLLMVTHHMQKAHNTFLPLASLCSFGAAGNPRILYHTTIGSGSGWQLHNAPNMPLFCLFLFPTLPASCPTAPPSLLRLVGRSVRRERWWGNPECQQRVIEVYPYDEGRTTEPR